MIPYLLCIGAIFLVLGRLDVASLRAEPFHENDHLGDELVIRTGRRRISYRREDIGLGFSYGAQPDYRLYAEAGYGYTLGKLNEPWRVQAGAEWEGSPVLPLGEQLFAAADLQSWEEVDWDPNLMRPGWCFGTSGATARYGMELSSTRVATRLASSSVRG